MRTGCSPLGFRLARLLAPQVPEIRFWQTLSAARSISFRRRHHIRSWLGSRCTSGRYNPIYTL